MILRKTTIVLFITFCIVDPVIAGSSQFFGKFSLDLTIGEPVCRQSTGSIEIGNNFGNRTKVYYIYLPTKKQQDTYTFTTDDGNVYTRTITILDQNQFRWYQKKVTSTYSTIFDLLFLFSDKYQNFVASGSIEGEISCKGPAIFLGDRVEEREVKGDNGSIQKKWLGHEYTEEPGQNIW
jgi:hypothetical protein